MSSSSVRPLLLLDVDGVLNAVARSPDERVWQDWRRGSAVADGRRWPVLWSPSVVAAVLRWRSVADVSWLTTWGHEANDELRVLLGLPELPVAGTYAAAAAGSPDDTPAAAHAEVAPAGPDLLTGRWWKYDVVRRLVGAQPARPLVWLDDDLAGQADLREDVERSARCLLLAPSPGTGLAPGDLDRVDAFLAAVGG